MSSLLPRGDRNGLPADATPFNSFLHGNVPRLRCLFFKRYRIAAGGVRGLLGTNTQFLCPGICPCICLIKGFKVKTEDSLAAGDTFNGALAVALTEGQSLESAVRFAKAAAALSVTRKGAQPSAPTRKAIEQLLNAR